MIKLMLVDDEPIIRKGIRTSIEWDKVGIEIVGEASNGADAIEKAMQLKPHIVITDIRMPIMDGLALSGQLKNQLPGTKIVILSGYEDFEYAREALSLGVTEYLLKPVGAEELISLITVLKDEVIEKETQKNIRLSYDLAINENSPHIKSNFIIKILKGGFPDAPSILERAKILNLNLTDSEYIVFAIDIDDSINTIEDRYMANKNLLHFSVMNIAEEILLSKASGLVCYSDSEHLIGLINAKNVTETFMNSIFADIQYWINKYLRLSVSIGIGEMNNRIMDINNSYSEAYAALRHKIYKGKSSIIHYSEVKDSQLSMSTLYPSEEEKAILHNLKTLNTDGLYETINMIFSKFRSSHMAAESIRNICSRLIVISISSIEEMGINIQSSLSADFNPYTEAGKFEILDDLQQWVISIFDIIIAHLQDNKTLKFKSIISLALKYIEENYQKDLSLSDIASIVYVTPNYLSRIFKEEVGINFTGWLNQFRVEKAKDLLKDAGAKTYSVANQVGYKDYKYFSHVFKKYTGYSPSEYKDIERYQ
ncbi:response regulator [Cohnella mopanensis]|uniref:response regulator n=1 Tax=Cohnella mopanensis TaxID=2911966 RepID=UPI001EF89089|nr:response regulator [Cohnella mopanensis]